MNNSNTTLKSNFAASPSRYVREHMGYYGYSYENFTNLCRCTAGMVKVVVIDKNL